MTETQSGPSRTARRPVRPAADDAVVGLRPLRADGGVRRLAAEHVSSQAALAPVAALLGAFPALFRPASMTIMPTLVDPAGLTAASAVCTGFVQAGSMLGR